MINGFSDANAKSRNLEKSQSTMVLSATLIMPLFSLASSILDVGLLVLRKKVNKKSGKETYSC